MSAVEVDNLEETFNLTGPPPRYVHVIVKGDPSRAICGARLLPGAPTFTAPRYWIDCPACRKALGR